MPEPRSSKSGRRSLRDENRAAYREAITEAAIRVFGSTGYADAKIADIAAEAGVATGTLYNYFSSKEEIFQSILDLGRSRLSERLAAAATSSDPLEHLRELIGTTLGFLEEHGALFSIYIQLGADSSTFKRAHCEDDDRFRRELMVEFERTLAGAAEHLRSDLPPSTLAAALGGLLNGFIVRWLEGGCRPGLRDETDLLLDLFFNGVGKRRSEGTSSR